MVIDVEAARAQTSGCHSVAHFNNAGAALPPDVVVETMVDHLRLESAIGSYEAGAQVADRLAEVYRSIADLVGGQPEEVALTDGATRGWNAAFYPLVARLAPGQKILTSRAEYPSSVMAALQLSDRHGVSLQIVESDASGQVDLEAVEAALATGDVGLVALTHVPTSSGLVEPAAEVGRLSRAAGVPFLLDACQSAGQLDLDVNALGCDALSAAGRKFLRGPRGTGFLWMRRELVVELEPTVMDLLAADPQGPDHFRWREDAKRFEQWEYSIAGRLGLGVAVDHALGWGLDAIEERVFELGRRMREQLRSINGVIVRDRGPKQGAIVTFTVEGVVPRDLADTLRAERVNVWQTPASHAPLDLEFRGIEAVVRASLHYYNTEAEIDRCCELVAAVAAGSDIGQASGR